MASRRVLDGALAIVATGMTHGTRSTTHSGILGTTAAGMAGTVPTIVGVAGTALGTIAAGAGAGAGMVAGMDGTIPGLVLGDTTDRTCGAMATSITTPAIAIGIATIVCLATTAVCSVVRRVEAVASAQAALARVCARQATPRALAAEPSITVAHAPAPCRVSLQVAHAPAVRWATSVVAPMAA